MVKIWSKKRVVNTLVEIASYWWDDAPDEWRLAAVNKPTPPKLGVSVWANNTQEFWQLLHVLACILAQHMPGRPSVEPEIVNEYLCLDRPMRYRKRKLAVERLYARVELDVRRARASCPATLSG